MTPVERKQALARACKKLYDRRRRAGVCTECGGYSDGNALCPVCSARNYESCKRTKRRKKDHGLCQKGGCWCKAEPGRTLCKACLQEAQEHSREQRQRRKAAGVCIHCGKSRMGSKALTCRLCSEQELPEARKRRQALRQRGVCYICKKHKAVSGGTCAACWIKRSQQAVQRNDEIRQEVLDAYGGKCAECGEADRNVLQVDHIDGGGHQHLKEISNSLSKWLLRNGFPEGYQLLCGNCHIRKTKRDVQQARLDKQAEIIQLARIANDDPDSD